MNPYCRTPSKPQKTEKSHFTYIVQLTEVPKLANVQNFIKRLKNRNDSVPGIAERLQFHAHSLQTLAKSELKDGKNLDERLNSALNFLSNQLSNWILKCTEYNKLPNFVPSAIRLALLVRNQSKAAYLVSFFDSFYR